MLNYETTLQAQPPVSPAMRQKAVAGMHLKSPYGYSPQHQDLLNGLADQNAANYEMGADRANSRFGVQKLQAQRDLALQGLQQMAQAQQNQAELANARSGMGYGIVSNLLSGLFR